VPEHVLVAHRLAKRFSPERPPAVDGISLEVSKGEVLSIVGPNGAGKSTLLQMLLGLLTPDEGTVRIFGVDIVRHRRKIAHLVNYASTDLSLPYSLSVRENLEVFALVYNLAAPAQAVQDMLVRFSLQSLAQTKVGRLSTGQIARLSLAKALISRPEILFLDEPTATLDPEASAEVRSVLREQVESDRLALVYTSHNMREVERLSDRILLIESGKTVACGSGEELFRQFDCDNLEEVFLRSMARVRESRKMEESVRE
jgi:ABC-2 type transport system ATP-binding protein